MIKLVDYLLRELKAGRLAKDEVLEFLTQYSDCANRERPNDCQSHPLLERNTSDLHEQRFSTRLKGGEFFLADHRVQGERVLPAVAYVEMARAAVERSVGEELDASAGWEFEQLEWVAPLTVSEEREVHLALEGSDPSGWVEYEIYSGAADAQQLHARGRVRATQGTSAQGGETAPVLDVAALSAQSESEISAEQCYEAFERQGIEYGAGHRALKWLKASGAGATRSVLARWELPESVRSEALQYELHPSVLDGALQAVLGVRWEEAGQGAWVPYGMRRVRVYGGSGESGYVRVTSEGAGGTYRVQLCDESGRVSVQIEGLLLLPMKSSALTPELTAEPIEPSSLSTVPNPMSATPNAINATAEALASAQAPAALSEGAGEPDEQISDGLQERVQRALVQSISRRLKVAVEEIDVEAELSEFGFDSISFTQFSEELNERYGLSLGPTVFFEHSSVQRLTGYLCEEHGAQLRARVGTTAAAAAASVPRPRSEATVAARARAGARRVLRRRSTARAPQPSEPIAIIGMSGRFPGAADVEEFWGNLDAGQESIEEIPGSRWDWRAIYGREGNQTPIKWGGFIEGVDEFDALFFGISPSEAQLMDPHQRLLLQYGWKALEDAGYAARTLAGSHTGVFIGTGSSGYAELIAQAQLPIEGHSSTGVVSSVGPNRLSYLLDLHGPSEPVETACSSSLVAVHRAVRAIRSGECPMALAGGINTILTPWGHIGFNKAGMLSPEGRCKVFSQAADGYVRGEGVGILVLKGLAAAERDGDHIYGLIRGSAENHGGRATSLTAPNPQAQAQVIKAAYEDARIDARTVSYVEAHGTGTALGDPIEIQGLKSAFSQLGVGAGTPAAQCGIGSLKSNVGHLEIAAGVAGLIKVLLQFKHRRLAKSLHSEPLNPYIELEGSPFYIVQEGQRWEALCDESGRELPRRAGISSFGFGGVNAHVIMEEYVAQAPPPSSDTSTPALLVLSGKSEERLREQAQGLLEHLRSHPYPPGELADVAYTLQVGREGMEWRLGFTAQSFEECAGKLEEYVQGRASQLEGFYVGEIRRNRETLSLFAADEELQSAIGGWVSRGKYEKLLELWVKGLTFDWQSLHAGGRRRLSLPSYPFARERHWIAPSESVGSVSRLHPLLERNTSDLSEQRFSTRLKGGEFFLADHRVQGERVLPAVAYVEMARAAVERSVGEELDASAGWEFEQLEWVAPLTVSEEREVHLALEGSDPSGWVEYEIYSGAADAQQLHARGRVRATQGTSAQGGETAPVLDVAALSAQSESEISAEQCYEAFERQGIEYGAGHRALKWLKASGAGATRSVLARWELPESVRSEALQYELHPSVLDGALQAVLGVRWEEAGQGAWVPYGMRRVRVYGGSGESGYVRVTSEGAGGTYRVQLCDESGRVSVQIEGLLLLPMKSSALTPELTAEPIEPSSLSTVPNPIGTVAEPSAAEPSAAAQVPAASGVAAGVPDTQALRERAVGYLKRLLSGALKLPAQRIESDVGLEKYGIDSVMALQLLGELERVFGDLPKTLLFEYRSLDELAGYLCEQHTAALAGLLRLKGRESVASAVAPAPARGAGARRRSRRGRARSGAERSEPIAIVGLSGRYPQARDVGSFWENLKQGRDCISEIPAKRWDHERYFDPNKGVAGKSYSKWGGFIEGVDEFDALFFNISPAEAQVMDPQERLFLQCVYHTLQDAGYTREALNRASAVGLGARVGVFVGVMYEEYQLYGAQSQLNGAGYALSGNPSSIANRVSYFCNFNGPSMAVDTMCSSSLTAIHLGCQSLRSGDCAVAIAGGVNVSVHPNKYLALSQGRFASSTGRCESFGEGGDGYVPGEGVGAVLLKRLSEAQADGDHIYGLIRGTSINHGGKTNGYTVPNPQAQGDVIERALKEAGVDARTVSYLEAHGTGTALGDPIEIKGLTQAFERHTKERQYCAIGSAKSNIGHLESAAGIAGLTKVLLQMKCRQLVPSLHSKELNPHIDFSATPFRVQQELQSWERPCIERNGVRREYPRIAGVSSFGAGGSNAHVIVEEYEQPQSCSDTPTPSTPALLVLSGKSEERLREQAQGLLEHLRSHPYPPGELADVAYTLQVGREGMEWRLGFTAQSFEECAGKLEEYVQGRASQLEGFYVGEIRRNRETLSLFAADEELQSAIGGWVSRGKYEKLLELWVKGLTFDWQSLHAGGRRRLSLPSYPFARERHWIAPSESVGPVSRLHPLLERNTSDLSEQRFSTRLKGGEFFLADHRVQGERVLPAVAYVEMARAAVERSVGEELDASAGWEFEQLEWVAPLTVSEEREVHLALEGSDPSGWVEYEIYSGAADAQQLHARGRVRATQGTSAQGGETAPVLDVAALSAQSESEISAEQCYEAFERQGIEYGAGHRALKWLKASGAGATRSVLARWELPESVRSEALQYELHPSVLDGALQAVLGVRWEEAGQGAWVPYGMRRVRVYGGSGESGYVRVTSEGAGGTYRVQLCDESGRVSVQIEGLLLLPMKSSALTPELTAEPIEPSSLSTVPNPMSATPEPLTPEHRLLLLSAQWHPQEALTAAAPSAQRRVLLSRAYESSLTQLRELAPQAQFEMLNDAPEGSGALSEAVHAAAEQLLQHLALILKGKPREAQLLQVVLCASQSGGPQLGGALSAMLSSASLENPRIKGQVLLLQSECDAQRLWESLERNGASGESQVLESADERAVWGYRLFSERQRGRSGREPWKDGGVYLISGGAGGLGLIFLERIVRSARDVRVILTGRSPLGEARAAQLEQLREIGAGCVLEYEQLDVTDGAAVDECVRGIKERHGSLSGVLHCAGVIRDSFLINKEAAQLHEVLCPKVQGTVHLDEATQGMELDCFIVFSSVAGALGNVGQVDYAAGNAFMDRYAHYRNELVRQGRRSGRTLSVNWPLWAQGGMSVPAGQYQAMRRQGIEALGNAAGVVALQEAWSSAHTQVLVLSGEGGKLKELLQRSLGRQLQISLTPELTAEPIEPSSLSTVPNPMSATPNAINATAEALASAQAPAALSEGAGEPDEQISDGLQERVQRALVQSISRRLKVAVEEIDVEAELSEFGFDSISFTQFSEELNERYGLSLGPTVFFEHSSVQRLTGYLCEEHGAQLRARVGTTAAAAAASVPRPRSEATVAARARAGARRVLRRRSTARAPQPSEPIAIIGMSGRFPGAADVEEFWGNLDAGQESIEEIPGSRWDWRAIYGREGNQTPIKWGGFIEGVDEFDALFFGISPSEAQLMDPHQRLLLQYGWKALEDAGYAARTLAGSHTGVFIGTGSSGYAELIAQAQLPIEGHSSTGVVSSVGPNRLSYLLDLHGPSEPVETACSSSLVAVHRAVRAIRSGECPMALAGGINTILTPWGHIGFNKAGMLSPEGRCKVFSQAADGYVRGEGVGILVLKGLAAAERDGDHIYGLIRGSAENHGGRATSLTAPNPQAQAQVIKAAYEDARIDARTVSYVEAHGTGTALGDPIEIQGLKSAFSQLGVGAGTPAAQCGIGSLKSNVGHLEIAAGVAGLIKVLLQFKHRRLAKSLHSEPLNPYIELEGSPFYIVQEGQRWEALCDESGRELPRRAGISSFGFGGVNAHVIMEEYVAQAPPPSSDTSTPALLVLSGKSEERLREQAQGLLEHLRSHPYPPGELADVAYTLQVGREGMEWRLGFTAQSFEECAGKLEEYVQGRASQLEGFYVGEIRRNRETLSLFAADEELQSAIGGWVSRGKYEKLLELWVKGLTFDWQSLHAGGRRRLSLPSYPFARERHWIAPSESVGSVSRLHPLLERNTSDLSEQRFSTRLKGGEFFLADHRVQGERVLPAVAYVEMARAAVERSVGEELDASAGWEFEQLEWVAPLTVSEEREVHLALEGSDPSGWVEYEIYSGAADAQQLHARGRVRATQGTSAQGGETAPVLDVAALSAQSESEISAEQCYEAFERQGIEYGAGHRALKWLKASGAGATRSVLARWELPESVRSEALQYELHPSVLDGALQAVLGVRWEEAGQGAWVPYGMRRVRVYGGSGESGYVRVTSEGAGGTYRVQLCDESGRVSVQIEGLLLLPMKSSALTPELTAEPIEPSSLSTVPNPIGTVAEPSAAEPSAAAQVPAASGVAAGVPDTQALRERAVGYLKRLLSGALKLPAQRIESDVGLEKYGIDSVMALQLLGELERVFGDLPKTLLFEYRSLDELAGYLCEQHTAALAGLLRLKGRESVASAVAPAPARGAGARRRSRRGRARSGAERSEPIAIVGLSGRYPQARDVGSFWENLKQGRDCISEIPAKRWDHERYFDPNKGVAGKSYSKWGGFIEGVDEFDALFFNISPAEAQVMDPQERLFLQCVYHTLQDAGYTREALNRASAVGLGARVGVFVGVMYEEYQLYGAQSQLNGAGYALSGNPSSIANRVSYFCNFNGPSMAVDTMCSSSLTAIHLGCQSLRSGDCAVAIAGGVNVSVHPNKYLALSQGRFASSTGRCESFGEGGDGYVPGEGVGAVLLKRLSEAQADGDHIYGLIRGTSINHGGKTNGYTVPNPQAQGDVIERALKEAGVDARTVSYLEAHGTGTALGDPIEIKGLTQAFERHTKERQYCAIGSAKSNIGHLESAAGIAGLTKVLLQMKCRQLVPSLHSKELNPHIDFSATPFRVQQELQSWERPCIERNGVRREYPRIAGVSSFGAGGSNAHVIVEEYEQPQSCSDTPTPSTPALLVLSGKSEERLREQAQGLLEHLRSHPYPPGELADVAYTLQVGREGMEWRLGFTAQSFEECAGKLEEYVQGRASQLEGFYVGEIRRNRETLSLFAADEELQSAIGGWVSRGKYEKLLELWVKGLTFDWQSLHAGGRRRLSLPSYPFARERHWIPGPNPLDRNSPILPAQEAAHSTPPAMGHHPTLQRLLDDLMSDTVDLDAAATVLDSLLEEGAQ